MRKGTPGQGYPRGDPRAPRDYHGDFSGCTPGIRRALPEDPPMRVGRAFYAHSPPMETIRAFYGGDPPQ